MHDGCKILRFDLNGGRDKTLTIDKDANIIKNFSEHESMAYGVDWSYAPTDGESLIASCSFYDHKLCLWRG